MRSGRAEAVGELAAPRMKGSSGLTSRPAAVGLAGSGFERLCATPSAMLSALARWPAAPGCSALVPAAAGSSASARPRRPCSRPGCAGPRRRCSRASGPAAGAAGAGSIASAARRPPCFQLCCADPRGPCSRASGQVSAPQGRRGEWGPCERLQPAARKRPLSWRLPRPSLSPRPASRPRRPSRPLVSWRRQEPCCSFRRLCSSWGEKPGLPPRGAERLDASVLGMAMLAFPFLTLVPLSRRDGSRGPTIFPSSVGTIAPQPDCSLTEVAVPSARPAVRSTGRDAALADVARLKSSPIGEQ